jgi:transcription elongation factor GreB
MTAARRRVANLALMSKAFTKEDSAPDEILVARRPPLPPGVPNYVTPRGLELLRAERQALESARAALRTAADADARRVALATRLAELEQRIASAQCVEPVTGAAGATQGVTVARFGSSVRLLDEAGREQCYQIVGVDEADPEHGKVAFLSPLAKALLGARVGDTVRFKKPGGSEELEVLAIE